MNKYIFHFSFDVQEKKSKMSYSVKKVWVAGFRRFSIFGLFGSFLGLNRSGGRQDIESIGSDPKLCPEGSQNRDFWAQMGLIWAQILTSVLDILSSSKIRHFFRMIILMKSLFGSDPSKYLTESKTGHI